MVTLVADILRKRLGDSILRNLDSFKRISRMQGTSSLDVVYLCIHI
jgi:hypothetical protein